MPLAYKAKEDESIARGTVQSVRFADMRLVGYVNQVDDKAEEQFSGVTFLIGDGSAFVAFRGTDDAMVGWKEDFNMSFEMQFPPSATR